MFKSKQKGFTLIELMIVIGIIGILASILIPNMMKARGQAQATSCGENIKTIVTAMEFYHTQYKQYPPETDTTKVVNLYLVNGGFLGKAPKCPVSGQVYEVGYYDDLDRKKGYDIFCPQPDYSFLFGEGTTVHQNAGDNCWPIFRSIGPKLCMTVEEYWLCIPDSE